MLGFGCFSRLNRGFGAALRHLLQGLSIWNGEVLRPKAARLLSLFLFLSFSPFLFFSFSPFLSFFFSRFRVVLFWLPAGACFCVVLAARWCLCLRLCLGGSLFV